MGLRKVIMNLIPYEKTTSKKYVKYLKKRGISIGIGERTTFFSPHSISIDVQYPWLIEIGSDVQITAGVRILTHDYSWSVLKKVYGSILGAAGKVKIGNNVFIGTNTLILGGTEIGDNVIIGAGSIVKGTIPNNCVAVGTPCKKVMSLDEFYNKRLKKQEQEANSLANAYYEHTHELPPKELFHEFFFLFENGQNLEQVFDNKLKLVGNYKESKLALQKHKPIYSSYDEFIKQIQKRG